MRTGIASTLMLTILIGSVVVLQPSDVLAQRREREQRRARRPAVVVKTPAEHARVVVGSSEYHYAHGVFYRSGPKGFIAIRGPVGARVSVLPVGYVSLQIGGAPFFFYYGTYYQLDPVTKEYVVVAPPPGAPTVPGLDKVDLITGETINGTFVSGTQNTIQFDVNGRVRQIPIEQIVSIVFSPTAQ
jgi:hypothetical protein